jgi:hypothetical protein
MLALHQSTWGRNIGHGYKRMRMFKWALTYCSIHRQYLTITNVTHRARLRDLMPNNCKRDIDIHGFTGSRI